MYERISQLAACNPPNHCRKLPGSGQQSSLVNLSQNDPQTLTTGALRLPEELVQPSQAMFFRQLSRRVQFGTGNPATSRTPHRDCKAFRLQDHPACRLPSTTRTNRMPFGACGLAFARNDLLGTEMTAYVVSPINFRLCLSHLTVIFVDIRAA